MKPRSLFRTLLYSHLIVGSIALAILGIALDRVLERKALDSLVSRLTSEARSVQTIHDEIPAADLQTRVASLGRASSSRITIVRHDGSVLADSEHDPATMANHATRPEIRQALQGREGVSQRESPTLGVPFLYVATPERDGIVVRAAFPATALRVQREAIRNTIAISLLLVGVLTVLLSALLSRSLGRPLHRMSREVAEVAAGSRKVVQATGSAEARGLAEAVNRMAEDLARRADELSKESSLRDQILSSMSEGVILGDPSGKLVYANAAASRLFGREHLSEIPFQVTEPGFHEVAIHHPTRRDLRSETVTLDDGRLLVAVQDVTEAKRLDDVRRDFVGNASHELKTPTASILATAETIATAAGDDPDAVSGFSERMVQEATRLSRIVEDLLDLSRLEQGPRERVEVSLDGIVSSEVDQILGAAKHRGLEVELVSSPELRVQGSEEDLRLMVRNLLDNSVRYTNQGSITVTLNSNAGRAILTVEDSGAGIPAEDLPRIFERFYRVDRARSRETGGTGLGLSIVRHVAESFGGTVRVESQLGSGSKFTVELPQS
ncbi:MAG TPA: ATP-binding protein [Actinomycetota bacterium]|nr:ATP-binding protein [Actinomycetota bacterium]